MSFVHHRQNNSGWMEHYSSLLRTQLGLLCGSKSNDIIFRLLIIFYNHRTKNVIHVKDKFLIKGKRVLLSNLQSTWLLPLPV